MRTLAVATGGEPLCGALAKIDAHGIFGSRPKRGSASLICAAQWRGAESMMSSPSSDENGRLSRRGFLRFSVLGALTVTSASLLAACGQQAPAPAAPAAAPTTPPAAP